MRAIKTAWKHVRRSPYQALAVILVMAITFFVATMLAVLAYASRAVIHYYETRPQVIVFLKDDAVAEEVALLQSKLEGDSRVKDVIYVSQEEAFQIYRDTTSDNPLLSEFVSPEVFPASLEFSVVDLALIEEVISELEQNAVVDQVKFTASLGDKETRSEVIENLRKVARYIKIGGGAVLVYLAGSSLLVLLVVIGMRVSTRREDIEILGLIGATPGFIRWPFIFEGIFYVVAGTLLGWVAVVLLVLYAMPQIIVYFGDIPVLPSEITDLLSLFGLVLGAELGLAVILGVLGSMISLARYLKI